MSLLITIVKAPETIVVAVPSMSFDNLGGTMGRGDENTWVLDDPELYLSTLHCQFIFEAGQYFIIDQSTNGTFYNGSVDPIGKGSRLPVNNNDRFIIGDYEFSITVQESQANQSMANDPFSGEIKNSSPSLPGDDPFNAPPAFGGLDDFSSSPFDSGKSSLGGDSLFAQGTEESDPLAALEKARGGSMSGTGNRPVGSNEPFSGLSHSDGANPLNQQIDWPESVDQLNNNPASEIPDDWDDISEIPASPTPQMPRMDEISTPLTEPSTTPKINLDSAAPSSREQALDKVNQTLLAENEALRKQVNAQSANEGVSGNSDTTFINALGFSEHNLSNAQISQINQLAGEVMREMVSGMMQVLGSRSSIKNEFRMNVTTIQPVENNPLKFSANVDDALENMFIKQGNAFKQPLDAVREGFDGVAEHQVAILAGIREAFKSVIERFDPITLEDRFSKQSRGGILPGSHKAKNWDAYISYYDELAGDADKSFQYLFGDGFVRAYEDQLQKLTVSKKSRAKKQET